MKKFLTNCLIFSNLAWVLGGCAQVNKPLKTAPVYSPDVTECAEVDAGLFPKESLKYFPPKAPVKRESKLDKILKGKLAGHGQDFEDAAALYKIPVDILCAISFAEVGPNGNSLMIRKYNNVSGSLVQNKRTKRWESRKFNSIRESIFYTGANLRNQYFNKGLTTVSQIKKKYCPNGAKNDPKGLNRSWEKNVSKYRQVIKSL